MPGVTILYTFISGLIVCLNAGTLQEIYIEANEVPVKGVSVRIVCEVSQFSSGDGVRIYKSDSISPADISTVPQLSTCSTEKCLPANSQRYTFGTSSTGVTITVTNLTRFEDQKYWTCILNNQRKYMQLTVYTITPSLQYDNPPSQDRDLVQTSVSFSCSTGCAFPSPDFIWYYNKTGGSRQEWSTTAPVTEKTGGCTDSEKIYTSTLTLPRYTQFTDNTDTTVKFQCGAISITGAGYQRFTPASVDVRFAVSATTPKITDLTKEKLEGDQIRYQCISSETRPVAKVTWKLGTQILTDVQNTEQSHGNDLKSVTSIVTFTANRTDNKKTIYCEIALPGQNVVKAQEKMTVYWPPSQPQIMNDRFPFLEGQTGKIIYCSSSDYGNPTATATWTSQYGTPDIADSRKLRLPKLTYQVDRSPVKCQLKNLFTQKKGLQIQSIQYLLPVEYSPRIQILVDGKQVNTSTKHEGQTLSAICNATGNPNPVVDWLGQPSRGPSLSFDDIDRTDHGKYTCKATATSTHYPSHKFITEEELYIIVNYAPDIIVNVSSRNPTEYNTITVKCEPKGRPSDYHFSSIVHKWGYVVISKKHNTDNGVIEVQNAQLQDSGTYICIAHNGIRDRNQKLDQSGNITVNVKVSPKILLKIDDRKFFGELGFAANITAPFYSDPPPQTVQFKFQNGTVITNSSTHTISVFKGNVKDTFYGKEVELDGYFAQLQIKDEEESDFVNYTLIIYNGIGSYKSWLLELIYENTPNIPRYVSLAKELSTDNSLTVQWNPDNDNGHKQTFILKYRKVSDRVWSVISILDMGYLINYTISGLTRGTYYEIILYASNTVGNSEESHLIGKTTGKPAECGSSCENTTNIQAIVVGTVLGCIILLLLTYAGYITILLKRSGEKKHENASCSPVNNVPVYTNVVYSTNDSDEQQQTGPDDSGDFQYTSLNNQLRDDKEMYDVLGVVS